VVEVEVVMGNSVTAIVTDGTTDRMNDLEGTGLGLVLPSDRWTRGASKKVDVSENSNELNVLNAGRVSIRLGVRPRVEQTPAAPPPLRLLLQLEDKTIALQADVNGLPNLIDVPETDEESMLTTGCHGAARQEIRVRRAREKRKTMPARRMTVTSPMLWLPCSDSVGSAQPR